jgi:Cu+-exporting ATPase
MGILFRKGDALQSLAGVDVIAFDKTGTLTMGRPEVTGLSIAAGFERIAVLRLASSLESRSEHPLARAIRAAAEAEGVAPAPVERFRAHSGRGASGMVEGQRVVAGSLRLLSDESVVTDALADAASRALDAGSTVVMLAIDGKAAALFEISDSLKPSAHAAISRLNALGIETALISGDNQKTAAKVGAALGIGHVVGEVLPAGKVAAIEALKQGGRRVAFVGDGINDGPALAAADTGLAMGTGTDVAIESADVVLVAGDPARVADAVALSRATMRNIRQNLFWAFGYNVLLIPVAMGVLYPFTGWMLSPMVSGAAMALSSVFVLSNALRLRTIRL